MGKAMLSFDLEFWHETDWMAPYLPKDYENNDCLKEQVELVLDLLDKYKAKATFFVTGKVAEKYPEVIKRIAFLGYEIASHGFSHRELFKMNPQEFEQELVKSKTLLEEISGKQIKGFRACRFSLSQKTKWALPILQNQGFLYDSSSFPMKTGSYGVSGASNKICAIDFANICQENKSSNFKEIPLTIVKFLGIKIPISGGVYFRVLPFLFFKILLKKSQKQRVPIIYLHPHELYCKTPQIKGGPFFKRILKYWGVKNGNNLRKFEKLLANFEFDSIENVLKLKNVN